MEMLEVLEQLQAEAAAGNPDAVAFLPTFADWVFRSVREEKRLAADRAPSAIH